MHPSYSSENSSFYLLDTPAGLGLASKELPLIQPLVLDFTSGSQGYKLSQNRARNLALAKACGIKPNQRLTIVDATLGLAKDASQLASLGQQVIGIEAHPWIFALVEDALMRAKQQLEQEKAATGLIALVENLQLINADACQVLPQVASNWQPDVVYLDPMFPASKSKAEVKKDMQLLRLLLGAGTDEKGAETQLFELARQAANQRLVIKRPAKAEFLAQQKPNYSLTGKTNRFDIYLT